MILTTQLKKFVRSLHLHKYRQKYNKFIAEGPKICSEFLSAEKYQINYIFAHQEWVDAHDSLLTGMDDNLVIVDDKGLKTISSMQNPNKILIVGEQAPQTDFPDKIQWGIYTQTIQDPGNMGTILRIADWYGMPYVFTSTDSVSCYNPKVIQSAMGAHNRVAIKSCAFSELKALSIPTLGLVLDGDNIAAQSIDSGLLIVGNESQGLPPNVISDLDYKLTIKKYGGAESLNAAVACGISCALLMGK